MWGQGVGGGGAECGDGFFSQSSHPSQNILQSDDELDPEAPKSTLHLLSTKTKRQKRSSFRFRSTLSFRSPEEVETHSSSQQNRAHNNSTPTLNQETPTHKFIPQSHNSTTSVPSHAYETPIPPIAGGQTSPILSRRISSPFINGENCMASVSAPIVTSMVVSSQSPIISRRLNQSGFVSRGKDKPQIIPRRRLIPPSPSAKISSTGFDPSSPIIRSSRKSGPSLSGSGLTKRKLFNLFTSDESSDNEDESLKRFTCAQRLLTPDSFIAVTAPMKLITDAGL